MPKVSITTRDGTECIVDAPIGQSLMNAIRSETSDILALCDGACSCATCHVHVEEAWKEKVGPPSAMEEDMLDFAFDVRPTSRLSCQIKVTPELDGLVVHTPTRQG